MHVPRSGNHAATRTNPSWARLELVGRSVVFALLVLWIVGGPFCRQVLDLQSGYSKYLRPWVMFGGRGIGFLETRFFLRQRDGTLQELNRFELLGYPVR